MTERRVRAVGFWSSAVGVVFVHVLMRAADRLHLHQNVQISHLIIWSCFAVGLFWPSQHCIVWSLTGWLHAAAAASNLWSWSRP